MPTPVLRKGKSKSFWLRKRVPERYREIVGRSEVWRSLSTSDERIAAARCAALSVEMEEQWRRRREAQQAGAPDPVTGALPLTKLTLKEAYRLAGECYREYVAQYGDEPGSPLEREEAIKTHMKKAYPPINFSMPRHKEFVYFGPISEFLHRKKLRLDEPSRIRFASAFFEARGVAEKTLLRHSRGDFSEASEAAGYPPPKPMPLDALTWFDRYAATADLAPRTIKRWRPLIEKFTVYHRSSDLASVSKSDVNNWKNELLERKVRVGNKVKKISPRTVRDAYIAALKATLQYLVDELKLAENPAAGVKIRGVETEKDDDEKGFSDKDARTILTATLVAPPPCMSVEMAAARRWVPWICAYTGARVNEITSLQPGDIARVQGIFCFQLPKERTKTRRGRNVPIHSHLIEQGFLRYVEERTKLRLPLFYDPARSRGGHGSHPHYQKVGERLAEWVRTMPIDHNVWPNHGWRHRWKSQAREIVMHPQIADFIQGHGSGSVSAKYGSKWPKTLANAVEKIPRYRIKGLAAGERIPWSPTRNAPLERPRGRTSMPATVSAAKFRPPKRSGRSPVGSEHTAPYVPEIRPRINKSRGGSDCTSG